MYIIYDFWLSLSQMEQKLSPSPPPPLPLHPRLPLWDHCWEHGCFCDLCPSSVSCCSSSCVPQGAVWTEVGGCGERSDSGLQRRQSRNTMQRLTTAISNLKLFGGGAGFWKIHAPTIKPLGAYIQCPPHGSCGAAHQVQRRQGWGSAGSAERPMLCSGPHHPLLLSAESRVVMRQQEPLAATQTTEQINN